MIFEIAKQLPEKKTSIHNACIVNYSFNISFYGVNTLKIQVSPSTTNQLAKLSAVRCFNLTSVILVQHHVIFQALYIYIYQKIVSQGKTSWSQSLYCEVIIMKSVARKRQEMINLTSIPQINYLHFEPHYLNQINLHQVIVISHICEGCILRSPVKVWFIIQYKILLILIYIYIIYKYHIIHNYI